MIGIKRRGRVATSRSNKYDGHYNHAPILTSERFGNMMVTSEFDGVEEKITGQHKATHHKARLAIKQGKSDKKYARNKALSV